MKTQRNADSREQLTAKIAATLPSDRDELIAMAAPLACQYDRAVMTSDPDLYEDSLQRLDALLYRLNGGTFFACGIDGGPRDQIAEAIRAVPGTVPHWGQPGDFLVETDDVRVRVEYRPGFTYIGPHMAFHMVDADRPFISPTGYQSHFLSGRLPPFGVDAVARSVINERASLHVVDMAGRGSSRALPSWIPPSRVAGQIGFVF